MEKPTKKESGCPTDNPTTPIITQRRWRTVCSIVLVCAIGMALYGVKAKFFLAQPLFALVYWTIFLLLLVAAFYIVILDVRFIRMQYAIAKREILRETLGDKTFREMLINAQRDTHTASKGSNGFEKRRSEGGEQ